AARESDRRLAGAARRPRDQDRIDGLEQSSVLPLALTEQEWTASPQSPALGVGSKAISAWSGRSAGATGKLPFLPMTRNCSVPGVPFVCTFTLTIPSRPALSL